MACSFRRRQALSDAIAVWSAYQAKKTESKRCNSEGDGTFTAKLDTKKYGCMETLVQEAYLQKTRQRKGTRNLQVSTISFLSQLE